MTAASATRAPASGCPLDDPDRARPRLAARRAAPAPAQDVRGGLRHRRHPPVQGQPGFIAGRMTHVDHLVAVQPVAGNVSSPGTAPDRHRPPRPLTVKPALVLSFVWALGVWAARRGLRHALDRRASPLTGAPGARSSTSPSASSCGPGEVPACRVRPPPRGCSASAAPGPSGPSPGSAWGSCGCCRRTGRAGASRARSAARSRPSRGGCPTSSCRSPTPSGPAGAPVAAVCGVLSFVIGLGPLAASRHTTVYLVAGAALALDLGVRGGLRGGLHGPRDGPQHGAAARPARLALYPNRAWAGSRAGVSSRVGDGLATPAGAMAA